MPTVCLFIGGAAVFRSPDRKPTPRFLAIRKAVLCCGYPKKNTDYLLQRRLKTTTPVRIGNYYQSSRCNITETCWVCFERRSAVCFQCERVVSSARRLWSAPPAALSQISSRPASSLSVSTDRVASGRLPLNHRPLTTGFTL